MVFAYTRDDFQHTMKSALWTGVFSSDGACRLDSQKSLLKFTSFVVWYSTLWECGPFPYVHLHDIARRRYLHVPLSLPVQILQRDGVT
jgi:hypothetical protein